MAIKNPYQNFLLEIQFSVCMSTGGVVKNHVVADQVMIWLVQFIKIEL